MIDAYYGFYGTGTGTFLLIALTTLAKLDIQVTSGNTKCINLASNISALVNFIINGKVLIPLGIIEVIFNIIGNYESYKLVLKNGAKIVLPIIIVVMVLLFIKILFQ